MRAPRVFVIALALLAAAGWSASAQAAPSPNGPVRRGFSPLVLIAQLSLFLPEEATREMYRGLRGGGAGGPGGPGAPGAGGAGASGSGGGRGFPQVQFTRDPALFLTRDQVAKLLPILRALRDAPFPTPSRARQIQADVDAQLTAGQKAEWEGFQKKMRASFEEFRQRMAASGGSGGPGGGPDGTGGAGNGAGTNGGAAGASPAMVLQRRQRQLDAFIGILQARLK